MWPAAWGHHPMEESRAPTPASWAVHESDSDSKCSATSSLPDAALSAAAALGGRGAERVPLELQWPWHLRQQQQCFTGYTGFDCYGRQCPYDHPWTDFALADDDVRSVPRECSHRGTCDRSSGRCNCDSPLFTGHACQKLKVCNGKCSGHGRCFSMREAAFTRNDYNLLVVTDYSTPWDADRVYGCVCDYGYTGPDCSQRLCPFGDDPITTGQVDEIQALSCRCSGCSGTFTLSFRGVETRPIDTSVDTAATLKTALEALVTIRGVSVAVGTNGATRLCGSTGVSTLITFTHEHGNVPPLRIDASLVTGGTSSITLEDGGTTAQYGTTATQTGTKEWLECSGRGRCIRSTGICSCDDGFEPSDGLGAAGTLNDCGYRSGGAMSYCPVGAGSSTYPCSGHGRCGGVVSSYRCTCQRAWSGHDCYTQRCPVGRAWFEEAASDNVAHLSLVECSNAGICDATGACQCLDGFEGVACDRLSCPSSGSGVCGNRGVCRTVREIAALTTTAAFTLAGYVYGTDANAVATWDANMVQGCYCDKVHEKRGLDVRYKGHDCSQIPCPRGDDPWTSSQVNEVQSISCKADGGSFTLSFRGETTARISYSASALAVQTALEAVRTISLVSVSFSTGTTSACTATANVMTVTFHSPSGPLPLVTLSSSLTLSTGSVAVSVARVTLGTTEDIVCNNRGRCADDSGTCICALHHASSNARGDFGVLNDCGMVDPFMTHGEL